MNGVLGQSHRGEQDHADSQHPWRHIADGTWDRMSGAGLVSKKELPTGWVEEFSRSKLQPYYVHLPSGATTWVRPDATRHSSSGKSRDRVLPDDVVRSPRTFVGLGLVLQQTTPAPSGMGNQTRTNVVVERIVPGGGAELSGQVAAGDVVVSVDGVDVRSMQLPQILTLIRGDEGTTCLLGIERPTRSPGQYAGSSKPATVFTRCSVLRVATPQTVFREQKEGVSVRGIKEAASAGVSDQVRDSLRRLNLPEKGEVLAHGNRGQAPSRAKVPVIAPGSFGELFLADSSPPSAPEPVIKPMLLPAGGFVDTRRPSQRQVSGCCGDLTSRSWAFISQIKG